MLPISKKKWFVVLLVLVVAGVAYGFLGNRAGTTAKDHNLVQLHTGNIEEIVTAQGTLEPKEYVNVGAQVSGQLEKLYVDVGDTVKSGDLIAQIDAKLFEAEVQGDEARLETLQANLYRTKAELRQAENRHERNKSLIKNKAISQEVLEDSQTALDMVKAEQMALEAQIKEARSTLEGNRANLDYTKIYAPIDGTVVVLDAKEGETLNARQTTPNVVQIAKLDVMTVRAQVAEADINKIKTGMEVYFTTLGSRERRWYGTVRQILPTPENLNNVVLYNVLVDVKNEDSHLMSGMTAQMFFVVARADDVPVIPTSALLRRAHDSEIKGQEKGRPYIVQLVTKKGLDDHVVYIGLSDRKNAEVLGGLSEKDTVLIPGGVAAQGENGEGNKRGGRRPRMRL